MSKIYGSPLWLSGGGGMNDTLPPLLDNFKATRNEENITLSASKMEESRAKDLAGAVWVYVKQPTLTSLDIYPPFSAGTEALYGSRPKPDTDGIYPYVYNMGIYEGMLVRDDDGVLYRSITGTYEKPTELLYHPKDVPALMVKVEDEGGEEIPSEEYP